MRDRAASNGKRAPSLAFLLGLLAASCGAAPRETFDLSTGEATSVGRIRGRHAIVVAEPAAIAPLASNRIVIRTGVQEIVYLAGAQWADSLPRLTQARMIVALERGGLLATRPGDARGTVLMTEIRRFEIDEARQTAIVVIAARLTTEGGRTLAARVFTGEAPAQHTLGPIATQALGAALEEVLRQLVNWACAAA